MEEQEERERIEREFCRKIYQDKRDSIFEDTGPNRRNFSKDFCAYQFYKLETFVEKLLSGDEIPFMRRYSTNERVEYEFTALAGKYYGLVPDFIAVANLLSPFNEYSERVNAFIDSANSLGLLSVKFDWRNIWLDPQKNDLRFCGKPSAEIFNALVENIRSVWKSKYKAKADVRRRDAEERYVEYCNYADALFDECSRLVVVRVDLYYRKEYSTRITLQQVSHDLYRLYENERNNLTIFGFKKGFINKIEYGGNGKGIHVHKLYFFDGSKRNNSSHVHLAELIGEYWVNVITKGRGDYWNVNDNAGEYEKKGIRGIGVINACDTHLRSNLNQIVIKYLCKTDQYIKLKTKSGDRVKLIRRGDFPKKPDIKRGRPRTKMTSNMHASQKLDTQSTPPISP